MNFGKWIIVAFILFAAFIGTLVTICVRQDVSLVSKDYYKEELAYQDQIRRISNVRLSGVKPRIQLLNGTLQLELKGTTVTQGKLKLFSPSNAKLDKEFTFEAFQDSRSFDPGVLPSGQYRVKIWWTSQARDFYYEEAIFIK